MELEQTNPPFNLYHGTTSEVVHSIIQTGINKGSRNHLHLSKDKETAFKVGKRHTKNGENVTILTIDAATAWLEGINFYCSKNEVWLTNTTIPSKYISNIEAYCGNNFDSYQPMNISFIGLYPDVMNLQKYYLDPETPIDPTDLTYYKESKTFDAKMLELLGRYRKEHKKTLSQEIDDEILKDILKKRGGKPFTGGLSRSIKPNEQTQKLPDISDIVREEIDNEILKQLKNLDKDE